MDYQTGETATAPVDRLEAGVDWITLTCRAGDEHQSDFDHTAWHAAKVQREVTRELMRPWKWRGYDGWRITGLASGRREDSDIIIASGSTATRYWRLFHKWSTNVSRLDLQATALFHRPDPDLVLRYYDRSQDYNGRQYTLLRNNRGGQTLYCGARTSDQYGRIYDKGVQAGIPIQPGRLWRYEVEFKGVRAKKMTESLFVQICSRRPAQNIIPVTVYRWFADRGVLPAFREPGGAEPIIIALEVEETNWQRQLRWLAVQVRPTVQQLITHHQLETITALGLQEMLAGD